MPTVTSPEQLFEHELQDIYYAEKALTKVLPKLADEATDGELSRAFTSHLKETEKHVTNLEKVFQQIGKRPEAHPCPGIDGIKKEHDDFVDENTTTLEDARRVPHGSGVPDGALRDRRVHGPRESGARAQAA